MITNQVFNPTLDKIFLEKGYTRAREFYSGKHGTYHWDSYYQGEGAERKRIVVNEKAQVLYLHRITREELGLDKTFFLSQL
jgi:hypothetical protein